MNEDDRILLALRRSPVLADLPEAALEQLRQCGSLERCGAGFTLYAAGEPGDSVAFVIEGSFSVAVPGAPATARTALAGALLGEMALLTHGRRTADVRSLSPAQYLRVDGQAFLELLDAWPPLARALLRTLAMRVLVAERRAAA